MIGKKTSSISRFVSGLWGLINNAGILVIGPIEWVPMAEYKRNAEVNLWGLIDVTKTFLPLVKKEKGRIVMVSSIAGTLLGTGRISSSSFYYYHYYYYHCYYCYITTTTILIVQIMLQH